MFCVTMLTQWSGDPNSHWIMMALYLGIGIIALLPFYILNSLALFRISHRRGISHAWLAWVPLGSSWILGSISDQYQKIMHGKLRKRRHILLITDTLKVVVYVLALGMIIAGIPSLNQLKNSTQSISPELVSAFAVAAAMSLAVLAMAIVGAVFGWMATYDLFRSCEPKNALVYVVVSLVVQFVFPAIEIIKQILMVAVCNKDLGMQPSEPQSDTWNQE